jgi:Cell Wall Hydrolase
LELRKRLVGAFSGPFWLSTVCAAFTPTAIGYQDLTASLARQPGVSERWRDHLIASPFGTIHAATFSFSRPIGTAMPEPYEVQLVNFDPRALDAKGPSADELLMSRPAAYIEYPTVNRRLKGDRMLSPQSAPDASEPLISPPTEAPASRPPPITASRPKVGERRDSVQPDEAIAASEPPVDDEGIQPRGADGLDETLDAGDGDDGAAADTPPETPHASEGDPPAATSALSFFDDEAVEHGAQVYFGIAAMGAGGGLERWEPGAAPVAVAPSLDPDMKLSALGGAAETGPGGETVVGRDNATRFRSPAERLGLSGKPRARAEKCVADAVYFEARGEPLRGQMAVAQVVMNRVFSGRYPNDVCGVVYQNANRHLACQFTFACEGKDLTRIDEPDLWEQAKRIAKDVLDGRIWLTEVGHATHYHAYWVHPSWVNEMAKLYKLGVHTFYRPRAWGDGSDAPIWSNVPVSQKPEAANGPTAGAKHPVAAGVPEAAASPQREAAKKTRTARL